MIKTILHLFKIHWKMILGNPSVIVQNMLRKTPKSLNAVDVILAPVSKCLTMVQSMVLSPASERVVTAEGVGVIHRSFSGMLFDMRHQLIGCHSFHYLGIYTPITLQKAEYNAFSGCTSTTLTFAPAAEVGLVNFNLALEFARFQFSHMINRLAYTLIHTGKCFGVLVPNPSSPPNTVFVF